MRPGYTPSADLLADGLTEWQMLFDSWAAERLMGFSVPQYTYAITGPGSKSNGNGYTIGPTGDWVGPRPESIIRANVKYSSASAYPVYLPIGMLQVEQWAALAIRQIPGINITTLAYYDPQYPNGVFNVFPPITGNSIELFTWAAFAVPATLGTSYTAPPGYMDSVVLSLAERLWPLCTHDVTPHKVDLAELAGKAKAARDKVRNINRPIPKLGNDLSNASRPEGYFDSFVKYTGQPY